MLPQFPKPWQVVIGLAMACTAAQAAPPNAETLRAGLRTANPSDETYLNYVATVMDQGRLPVELVESTFLWARRRSDSKRFQYFKFALISRAGQMGITMPADTPATTGTIHGRVVARILLVDVPAADVTLTLEGSKRETTSDSKGEFTFREVPWGTYTLRATGTVAMLSRSAAARVMIPSPPPSDEPVLVSLRLK